MRHLWLLVLGYSAAAPAQDWAAIDRQLAAVQKAVEARDLEAAEEASTGLWRLTVSEWSKSHKPADYLRETEARVAANPAVRNTALLSMAMLAAQSGEWEKARNYALDALTAPSPYTDPAHAANNVLGLVALHKGDVATAELYLRAAGKAKGSTLLKRWGPTLALAKALLEQGRNDAVLEYFQDCQRFVTENSKQDTWIATLKGGGTPDLSHEYLWYR